MEFYLANTSLEVLFEKGNARSNEHARLSRAGLESNVPLIVGASSCEFGSMRSIVWKLTNDRQIDFAVARRRMLEVDSASVNSCVALANIFQGEFRGDFGMLEERASFQTVILPVAPLIQVVSPSRVETATERGESIYLSFI